jgi:hypothetical protein
LQKQVPQLGFLVSAKAKANDVLIDVDNQFTSTDFSWAFGLGYELAEFALGVNFRYNLGLVNIADGGNSDLKNSVFQLGVYKTFRSNWCSEPKINIINHLMIKVAVKTVAFYFL